jgi:hypothetical protein
MTQIDVTSTKRRKKGRNIPYVLVGSMLCLAIAMLAIFILR